MIGYSWSHETITSDELKDCDNLDQCILLFTAYSIDSSYDEREYDQLRLSVDTKTVLLSNGVVYKT